MSRQELLLRLRSKVLLTPARSLLLLYRRVEMPFLFPMVLLDRCQWSTTQETQPGLVTQVEAGATA
jgi:hypothetical protein